MEQLDIVLWALKEAELTFEEPRMHHSGNSWTYVVDKDNKALHKVTVWLRTTKIGVTTRRINNDQRPFAEKYKFSSADMVRYEVSDPDEWAKFLAHVKRPARDRPKRLQNNNQNRRLGRRR